MGKYITAVLLVALLSGCASYPIAKNLREQAQPLTLNQVTANPKTTRGTMVVWGGRIIRTVNDTNGSAIYVLQRPLSRKEKPTDDHIFTGGRFIVISRESLDPATYPTGSLITVAGQLSGVRNELLQNTLCAYPMVDIKQVHLWATRQKDFYFYNYAERPALYWGYYEPLWWNGGVGWYYPEGYGGYYESRGGESR
jgi:outer membrane lipoprotein